MKENIKEITLSQIIKAIKINARALLIFTAVISLIVILISLAVNEDQGSYQTTAAIQINNYAANSYVDQQLTSLDSKVTDTPNYGGLATRSEVEEALIKSGYILIPIIKENNLDIVLKPIRLQIVTNVLQMICERFDDNASAISNYCKHRLGTIKISQFNIPSTYLNKNFIIMTVDSKTYKLYYRNKYVLSGTVGQLAANGNISIKVDSITVTNGAKFKLSRLSMDGAISKLSKQITIEPVVVGKNFVPPITGILKISMSGNDPKLQAKLINDIINQLKKTAIDQHDNVLRLSIEFVEQQMKITSKQLSASQLEMVNFQAANNVISLDNQEKAYIQELSTLEQSILDNKILINQYSKLYASEHPLMIDLYTQRDFLAKKKTDLDDKINLLPKNEAMYINLKRNLDIYQQLYLFLVNKDQDLKMKLSSLISPVEILYYASSEVAPAASKGYVKLIGLGLFITLAIMLIIFLNLIFMSNSDPWLMPELSNKPLLAVFPYLNNEERRLTHRSTELTVSYLLHRKPEANQHAIVVNMGNISKSGGKTFIISRMIKSLTELNKKCLHVYFELDNSLPSVPNVLSRLKQTTAVQIAAITEMKINGFSAMDNMQVLELLAYFDSMDFIFIESPSTEKSVLFLNLATMIKENILIVSSNDTRNKLEWLINDIKNLSVTIKQIIYNTPKKTLIKSIPSVGSYNQ